METVRRANFRLRQLRRTGGIAICTTGPRARASAPSPLGCVTVGRGQMAVPKSADEPILAMAIGPRVAVT